MIEDTQKSTRNALTKYRYADMEEIIYQKQESNNKIENMLVLISYISLEKKIQKQNTDTWIQNFEIWN